MENLKTKEININGQTFILFKIPAVPARRLAHLYLPTIVPLVKLYSDNEKLMYELLSYVGIPSETGAPPIRLVGESLINKHVDNWETLTKLEEEMICFNTSFFQHGSPLASLKKLFQSLIALSSKISILSSEPSSPKEKPHSTN